MHKGLTESEKSRKLLDLTVYIPWKQKQINYEEVTGQRKVGEGCWASRGSKLEEGKYMGNYKDKGISVRSSFLCVQTHLNAMFHVQ